MPPLVKYTTEEIEAKEKELGLFIRHFPLTRLTKHEGFLVYSIKGGDILKTIGDANTLIRKLGLVLFAVKTSDKTFMVK